jgi:glycosyltransferase involved in cell wall biosynthesis
MDLEQLSQKVSIIIPTYNRENTIKRSVNSVLNQGYKNIEVIIVDDGSQDSTATVLSDIKDKRVRVISHIANLGLGAARNTGILAATGDLIAFQDSDDEWLDGKLSLQVSAFNNAPDSCVCVYCTKIVYGRDDKYISGSRRIVCVPSANTIKLSGDLREDLWRQNLVSTQTILCKRESALQIGGFDSRLRNSVDWDFVLRLADIGSFEFVDLPLVNTYIQDDSVSKLTGKSIYSQLIIINKMKRRGVSKSILSEHWALLGYKLGRNGYPRRGAILIKASICAHPFSPKVWSRLFINYLRFMRSAG